VAVVQTSAPAAILPLMYAIRFNRAPDLLAATILATTLLSGLSLTVLIHYLPYIP
jgi:predicted permease